MKRNALLSSLLLLPLLLSAQFATLVKDISPGSESGIPSSEEIGILYQEKVLFTADDGVHGTELWITDGTEEGTKLVKDINPGNEGSDCGIFHLVGDQVFFIANHPDLGRELWKTDGTEAGTQLIRDINSGSENGIARLSFPRSFYFVWNNVLYFPADDGNTGFELWRSDGTEVGTYLIKDFDFGNGFPEHYAVLNNKLYFTADAGAAGRELWVTDGTAANTKMVVDISSSIFADGPSHLFAFQDKLLFIAEESSSNSELWISDGTAAGTRLLKEINPSAGGMETNPNVDEIRFHQLGDIVLFSANDGTNGKELWRTDGTTEGTQRVRSVSAGSGALTPQNFVVLDGVLYYKYDDGDTGAELWRSDGTDEGTYMVKDVWTYSGSSLFLPTVIGTHQGKIYFNGKGSDNKGKELWESDGTEEGTVRVTDINPGFDGSSPGNFYSLGEHLLFSAYHPDSGYELWRLGEAPELVTSYSTNSPVLCFGEASGQIELAITGGVPPYEIKWSNDSLTGDTLANLTAGQYAITISDAADNEQVFEIEIEQPEELQVEGTVSAETQGAADGSITLSINGGTPPYLVNWNLGQPADTTTTLNNLSGGEYQVEVTDANGCVLSLFFEVDVMTALRPLFSEGQLQAFPNPATDQLTFKWNAGLNEYTGKSLIIYNAVGQLMLRQAVNDLSQEHTIPLQDWASGLYTYHIIAEHQLLVSGKVTVQ